MRRTRSGPVAAVVGAALVVVAVVWPWGLAGELSYLAVVVGAAVSGWLAWRRRRHPVSALIAAGVGLSALGDLAWQVHDWFGGAPDVSVADVGWLGSYVAIGAALLRILRTGGDDRLDIEAWIDIAAVSALALLLQWQLSVATVVSDPTVPWAPRVVWTLYPAFDSVLLALVARAAVARRLGRTAAALLVAGAGLWLAADFGYTLLTPGDTVEAWLNAGWMVGAALLATAAWQPVQPPSPPRDDRSPRLEVGPGRIVLALIPLLAPGGIELSEWLRGHDPNPIPLFGATVVFVGLAFVRGLRLTRAEAAARSQLESRERLAQAVAANGSDASVLVDADGTICAPARALAALVGRAGLDTVGVDVFDAVAPVDIAAARAGFGRVAGTPGATLEGEVRVIHDDGRRLWLGVRAVNLLDDPDVAAVLINLHDITDRKAAEQALAHQAFHDGLTGLPNRALFADRTQQALRRATRSGRTPAVIFLDLDGFKTVNDCLGHAAGDSLLRDVAGRLVDAVRPGDTVARLGGDEFAVLLEHSHRAIEDATTVANRILAILSSPFEIAEQRVTVSASLGIAGGTDEDTAASLLRDADVAMYRAKRSGKGRWVVHDAEMRAAAVQRLQLEADLLLALESRQFRLVYQPIVRLDDETVVGFEALLRWHHPTLGVVPPTTFVPIVEDNGLIGPIGAWALDEACATLARWRAAHPVHHPLTMSINVSARQISSVSFVDDVAGALRRWGVEPSDLVLEMTETALVHDPVVAADRLRALRRLGVRLAIDDFGTGYSSLSYLRQFSVDVLKIDRSFVQSISEDSEMPAIVKGLLDLGHRLDLAIVAEGVENEVQRRHLRAEGCDFAQGFLFARPLDPAAAEALLAASPTSAPRSSDALVTEPSS